MGLIALDVAVAGDELVDIFKPSVITHVSGDAAGDGVNVDVGALVLEAAQGSVLAGSRRGILRV